jgi:hypothetical protein
VTRGPTLHGPEPSNRKRKSALEILGNTWQAMVLKIENVVPKECYQCLAGQEQKRTGVPAILINTFLKSPEKSMSCNTYRSTIEKSKL